jgi:hypothetical protein
LADDSRTTASPTRGAAPERFRELSR